MSISVYLYIYLFRHTSLSYSRYLRFWGDGCLARYTGTRNCCENVWPDSNQHEKMWQTPKPKN